MSFFYTNVNFILCVFVFQLKVGSLHRSVFLGGVCFGGTANLDEAVTIRWPIENRRKCFLKLKQMLASI